MSTADNNSVSTCANCGKEGDDVDNICNKCKLVKYCNAACKKKHRHKHKKQCERRVAELHDKELFKQPPPKDDCPICFLRIPSISTGRRYNDCCGKVICSGCAHAPVYDNQGNKVDNKKCPFCRVVAPKSNKVSVQRLKERVEAGDPIASNNLGFCYAEGSRGFPQDYTKALKSWHRAAELGFTDAYCSVGYAYDYGEGVEVDKEKATYYYELAAIGGSVAARYVSVVRS